MPARPLRRAAILAGALTATSLAFVAPTLPGASAAETPVSVTWSDCEVRYMPYAENRKVSEGIDWTTPVRLDSPTPIPAFESVTVEAEIGALPVGLLPVDLTEVYVDVDLEFTAPAGSPLEMYRSDEYFDSFTTTDVLTPEEIENDETWADPAIYDYRAKSLDVLFTGLDPAGEFAEYSFECDQIPSPSTVHTLAVYDLNATPEVLSNEFSVKQGQTIQLTGKNLLTSAPTEPPAQVTVTVGGIAAGSFPLDASGGFVADVRVPDFVAPGSTVTVRVVNGAKSATTQIEVKALKAKIKATPSKAKSGKKVKITGGAFKPGEKVTLTLKGGKGKGARSYKASVKAKADGTISKAIKLKKAAKGTWRVTAKAASSKRSGKTSFKVS